MPLSEDERKRLEELDRELTADDPKLAQEMESGSVRQRSSIRAWFGFITAAAGPFFLVFGIITQAIVAGIVGFILMCIGAYLLLDQWGIGKRIR